ncbi:GTP-binding protein [Teredinibacter sp. KSP-S5-2]|uniref:CobW family GTP-binding protein n=1 Tax=Teredinibacter sp. KSP-S5-2 TaxID=3034506 RepID=UPI002934E21D|nr:GTP-binding protein [Teredinibacter sp. KSP-S5-2]WNO11523.1 GTP-binding protein [Teredinibacter sp. KSP-S5-2]
MHLIQKVPTNIITGFLGTGKTTAINQLMRRKPEHESWAVLVNEFGDIGVDNQLIRSKQNQDVFIKEVPGGCMCCVNGLPMQVALNKLLAEAKPQRLIIEPTGLGHPLEIIEVLTNPPNQNTIELQAVITLVDARKITDERYISNATFIQQLTVADILVANKEDLYQANELEQLNAFIKAQSLPQRKIISTYQGALPISILNEASQHNKTAAFVQAKKTHSLLRPAKQTSANDENTLSFPECGYITTSGQSDGYTSKGWLFNSDFVFDYIKAYELVDRLHFDRVKAVFITQEGILGCNKVGDELTLHELDEAMDSRIEIISEHEIEDITAHLLDCVIRE